MSGDKVADFENPNIFEYLDLSGNLLTGAAALDSVRAEQGGYGSIFIDTTDPTFTYAGAYADLRISTFGLTTGHNSVYAFQMQHDSVRLTAGGWGGGLFFGLSATATGYTGISLWLKGHGWGIFRVNGFGQGMSGADGGSCEIDIPAEWTRFDIAWSNLKTDRGAAFYPSDVEMIDWWMDRVTAGTPALNDRNFEIIVDDIYLMK
ncbi:MAG TPA: hypothetical protein VGJ84_23480 [Polyangiaceae bacterium]